jgi:hypothetical protein
MLKLYSTDKTDYASIYNDNATLGLLRMKVEPSGVVLQLTADGVSVNSAPTSKVIFIVASTTQGSKPYPTMTTAQKNTLGGLPAAEGLIVYDTDLHKLCIWTGAAWETFTSA